MSRSYDIRRARRERERQRDLCGETLADFHARETPARTAPGAGIPRARCDRTVSLFDGFTDRQFKHLPGLFDEPNK